MSTDPGFTFTKAVTEEEKPSRFRSLIEAPVKGFAEMAIRGFGMESPQEAARRLLEGKYATREEQIAGELQKFLPTREEPEEEMLQRFGGMAGIPLPGMGFLEQALRAGGAALLGQTAKEVGVGPLGQALAEVPAWGIPRLSRILQPTKEKEALVQAARGMGLTEEQITRSIQEPKKVRILGKFAAKGLKTEEAIRDTQEGLGKAISNLRESAAAKRMLPPDVAEKMLETFSKDLGELPVSVRTMILPDFVEFEASPKTIDDTINLWRDINAKYGGKGKALQKSKEALLKGIKEANPDIGERFELLNKLYSRFADLRGHLAPGVADDLVDLTEKLSLAYGVVKGNKDLITKAAGAMGIRKLAEKALISPRLQFLGKQLIKSAKKAPLRAVMKIGDNLERELKTFETEPGYPTPRIVQFD